ncbi:3-hydroxyacyl-CoA dehydrogenase NAD-binding domain-containing protein [Marinomonas sp. TW1]|uniref:3-hydroxyacyl-CoA dehydrogenase NAD-binding domain-containing protein n=1 Tax=Marinomonas sp. TW1 TaxID=1561203 RepID=UPI0007B308CA|nr:3-hydroxyacyl-CoA dehydrogenase NAD-binding domain-containing protein [Marinomonas sp. TW1]KZN13970.1 hypothetical protein OA79_07750 [Marinomonas sp. TW1]
MKDISLNGRVGVIHLSNPPLNSINLQLRLDLVSKLEEANASDAIDAIVLYGTEEMFSCGADIDEFFSGEAGRDPNLPMLVELLQNSPKPVVAAVGKQCMGGGLELALACHARVFRADAVISFPEIHLGLIPGAGGTQLLPRAIGLSKAVSMILGGRPCAVKSLEETPLVSRLSDNVLTDAITFANQLAEGESIVPIQDLKVDKVNSDLFLRWVSNTVRPQVRRSPSSPAAVTAIEASLGDYKKGLQVEKNLFWERMSSAESEALRYGFKAERECWKVPGLSVDKTNVPAIEKVGVVGAGTMGSGIAINFLSAGIPVVLLEQKQDALQRGIDTIHRHYEKLVAKSKLTDEQSKKCLNLLTPSLSYDDMGDVDLAIEAVFEDMSIKESVFRTLSETVRENAILASNTSTLDLNQIAQFCRHPERVVGLHFFSPANVMKLLEVVRADLTSDAVLSAAMTLAKRIKKTAVVSGVCDGFIGNRMINEYLRIAGLMVESGASPWEVDQALEEWGMAMGPFRMMDLAGNDVGMAIRKRTYIDKPEVKFSSIPDRVCELGRLGQKSGKGWYQYVPGQRGGIPDDEIDRLIQDVRESNGVVARPFSKDDIIERCIYALVNEGARILEEGIALRASDIDVVYTHGYGFPASRGGPMHYANQKGLVVVKQKLELFANEANGDANFWRPSKLISDLAQQGHHFDHVGGL